MRFSPPPPGHLPSSQASCVPAASGAGILANEAESRIAQIRERLAQARGFIVDLDGTLVASGQALPGAAELLDYVAERYVIVSNNSRDTALSLSRKLGRLGLRVEADRIVLAGEQAVLMVAAQHPQARIRLISSGTLMRFAKQQGCNVVDTAPDFVVLGRDVTFTYEKLTTIVNEVRSGARLIVTNPDLSHPAADGRLMPETGALMRAVVACSGVMPEQIVGKPGKALFIEGLQRLGTPAAATLVIGDNPATDALGATRLGMPQVLVGSHPHADVASLAALFAPRAACARAVA
jgi:4-nitrophenyl phosphatase